MNRPSATPEAYRSVNGELYGQCFIRMDLAPHLHYCINIEVQRPSIANKNIANQEPRKIGRRGQIAVQLHVRLNLGKTAKNNDN